MKRIYLLFIACSLCGSTLLAQENNGTATATTPRTLSADSLITTDARLDSLYHTLPEVMITGERPIVKASQGKLVYDLPRLVQNLPVDNAYDAVKELPGVIEMDGRLQLAGQSVTVILDGKVTTLTSEQLEQLLRSIPTGRIEKAEVMYNAPARYQVRGALINILLKQSTGSAASWQGELYAKYRQKHREGFEERASLLYHKRKFSADFLYSHTHGRSYSTTGKEAVHTLADGFLHYLTTNEASRGRSHTHNFRIGADYDIAQAHRLSLVYNGAYSTYHNRMTVTGTQLSTTHSRGTDGLHNGRLDYHTPFGLKAGAELTYYRSPSSQLLHSRMQEQALGFRTEDCQRINRWKFFLAQEHALKHGWSLNYGAFYTTCIDHSYQQYYHPETGEPLSLSDALHDLNARRREQTWNLYAGFSKSFGTRLTLDASLAAEHYKTPVWNQWDCYPNINLSYTPAPGHILQFALSSDKEYPAYWAVQDAVSYIGGAYSEVHGNPLLKPAQDYQLQMTYILRGKYIFSTWFNHTRDYSVQTLYQSSERLAEIYKELNFDYQQKAGIQVSIPFYMKNRLNSRLTLIGLWHREKDSDFWDIPFDRKRCYVIAQMNHTFTLSTRPDWKLTLTGFIHSKALQGIYDLPTSGNVNIALRYGFAKDKAVLHLYCNDLFETGQISPCIRFRTQYVTNRYSCFRELGVSFTYKFGGYKEKEREEVDRSRFK
ncbi:MAG: outer membrane beta-barrel protein [Bacteroides sp.]|nr:outer membrane beta-barrel protein [Bacteroides sp.]